MKGIYTRKRKGGTSVSIGYTPPGQSRVSEIREFVDDGPAFSKRLRAAVKRAEDVLIKRRAAIVDGCHEKLIRSRATAPTFAVYVREHYAPALRRSSMKERPRDREIERVTAGTVGRHFGALLLDQVTRSEIERFIDARLEAGAGAAGVNRDLARLRHLLNDAADREELGVDLPRIAWRRLTLRETPTSYRPMRDDEELKLLAELRDPIVRALVEVLTHTGIRPEAGLALRWRHVDLERWTVTVDRELDKVARGYVVYANARVQAVLRALYAFRPEVHRQPEAFVFAHRNGKPRRSIRTAWSTACDAAGVEGLHVRGLRATAATRLQESGATELDVKLHLGHAASSLGITGRYLDPHEEHRRKVAELTVRGRPANVIELHAAQQDRQRAQARGVSP